MAIILKNTKELLNATTIISATGSSVQLQDNLEGFSAVIVASSVGGTTPTFDAKIEHSHDGTTWFDLVAFTQITADATEYKAIGADVNVMEYIRYDLVVTGTTPTADLEVNFVYNNIRSND